MTEEQWFACDDPRPMLEALDTRASARKLRLFACACCRRMWDLLPDARFRVAVAVAERFADGNSSAADLASAGRALTEPIAEAVLRSNRAAEEASFTLSPATVLADSVYMAALSVRAATQPAIQNVIPNVANWAKMTRPEERTAPADLLRDLFSDQFRFVVPAHEWFTSDVMALANNVYENRAFDLMPILADALQDAGCDNDDVLNHCRNANQVHARGCWVIDLILGKV